VFKDHIVYEGFLSYYIRVLSPISLVKFVFIRYNLLYHRFGRFYNYRFMKGNDVDFIKKYYKIFILVVVVAALIFSPLKKFINIETFTNLVQSIKDTPYAPYLYILIYVLGVIFAVPGFALTIIAGPIFGFWKGVLLVIIASNLGCHLTFFISRFIGGSFVERFIKEDSIADKLSRKIEENGFLVMLYIRLLPIFPFNIVNYVSGLTSIKYRAYAIATIIGMLPGTLVYVYLSVSAVGVKDNPLALIISIGLLVLLTIGTTIWKKKQKLFKEEDKA